MARPNFIQPRIPPPFIDPLEVVKDRWFPASGFEIHPLPPGLVGHTAAQRAMIEKAACLTLQAAEKAKLKPVETAESEEAEAAEPDDAEKPKRVDWSQIHAASLHIFAAELRREAGDWVGCAENFTALTRFYLGIGDTAAAAAYLRKLLFVSTYSADYGSRLDAYEFAAPAFVELGMGDEAGAVAARTAELVRHSDDEALLDRSRKLTAGFNAATDRPRRRPPKMEQVPTEFRVRARPPISGTGSLAWSSWSASTMGIDLLMQWPGEAGECRTWVSHRIDHGTHQYVTLPNWSGRAMRAAKDLLEASDGNSGDTAAPASIVLQVAGSLEAFINSVAHFISESEENHEGPDGYVGGPLYRWRETKMPGYLSPDPERRYTHSNTVEMWVDIGKRLYDVEWLPGETLAAVKLIFALRNELLHYKGNNEEIIGLDDINDHGMVKKFAMHIRDIRPQPSPWIDRVLTSGLSAWAIKTGETMIAAFRKAWWQQQRDFLAFEKEQTREHPDTAYGDESYEITGLEPSLKAKFDEWKGAGRRKKT